MKKNDGGCLVAVLAVGIPLYFIFTCWPYIAVFAVILVAAVIIAVIANSVSVSAQTKNVQYAIIVGRTRVMTTKSRPSGYSISSRGNFRAYWRFRDEIDHTEIEFEVHYEGGKIRNITTHEGSALYNRLMPYVGMKSEPSVPKPAPPVPIAEQSKSVEISPPNEPVKHIDEIKSLPEAQAMEPQKPKRQEEKRFVEVPFEVAPNEYNLAISYPSCQMIRWTSGEYRIKVRFAASYDPTVKGLRNRVITCATVDSSGRMTAVEKEFKPLDLSGSKMVEIMFCDNAEQTPAKIIVAIDRHY